MVFLNQIIQQTVQIFYCGETQYETEEEEREGE